MDSKEFGLVAAQQLLQLKDLHYGFWEKDESPAMLNFFAAQDKHTSFLFDHVKEAVKEDKQSKILDIGCGVGITTQKLLEQGYRVDGLVPSSWMANQARENTKPYSDATRGEIFECTLEQYPVESIKEKYKTAFFSESFQYIKMDKGFDVLSTILTEHGTVVIFDFFKKDGVPGKSPIGGGHSLEKFYNIVNQKGYTIETDIDVTDHLSQNVTLVNDILMNRFIPFTITLDTFLMDRYKTWYKFVKFIFRKRLKKLNRKYSSERNEENYKKYKTYRLIVLKKAA